MKKGWTIREVHRRTGIPETTLCNLEHGRGHAWPAYRRKLAQLFQVKADLLFAELPEADDQARAAQ